MQRELEGEVFEVILGTLSPRLSGSKAERVRWWLAVFDLAPSVPAKLRASVREQLFTVVDNMKIPSEALPVDDDFLLACGHNIVFWGGLRTHESILILISTDAGPALGSPRRPMELILMQ